MKKWKTILALILMGFAIYFDWGWFWAIFILLGLIHILKTGEIHFVEAVTRKNDSNLYWFMIGIWTLLAIYQMWTYLS